MNSPVEYWGAVPYEFHSMRIAPKKSQNNLLLDFVPLSACFNNKRLFGPVKKVIVKF